MTRRTPDHLAELARTHLDGPMAERWLALLRPAVHLAPAAAGDEVVARLGGTPVLPEGVEWPEWPGFGPLSFVAEVDLAAVARRGLDACLALPTDGRLLAFYHDDPDGLGVVVHHADPETAPGSRLLHVTQTPPTPHPAVELTGVQVLTWPDSLHPELEHLGLDDLPDPFDEALDELLDEDLGPDAWGHQLGGWARPVQGSVEQEAAESRLGAPERRRFRLPGRQRPDPHTLEARRWRPLLQVDSDERAGTCWGDMGCLYWLARTDGSTPLREPEIAFTWQCS